MNPSCSFEKKGVLFVVGTPIGNLKDISERALDVLRSVPVVACEDTRVFAKIASRFSLKAARIAIHAHSREKSIAKVVSFLLDGKDVAYVSDAGTPGIADPGAALVSSAVSSGVIVSPIPGPSSLTALVSVAGFSMQTFRFAGFAPHKKGRETFFRRISESEDPTVFFDGPSRIVKDMELLAHFSPEAQVVCARELTKIHEEIVRGNPSEIIKHFMEHPERVRGEFIITVVPKRKRI